MSFSTDFDTIVPALWRHGQLLTACNAAQPVNPRWPPWGPEMADRVWHSRPLLLNVFWSEHSFYERSRRWGNGKK